LGGVSTPAVGEIAPLTTPYPEREDLSDLEGYHHLYIYL
jgi:hypothetical protein